jgi:hypothetical protein
VAPSHQRRGIGTALFLARLALLTPVDGWTTIRMSAVPNSIGFYRRFGVLFTQQRANGFLHAAGILDVRAAEIDACRNALADRHVSYPDVSDKIPRVGPTGKRPAGSSPAARQTASASGRVIHAISACAPSPAVLAAESAPA